ncbi:MAG: hypothetical protein A2Y60_04745 [Chloroflexi bacterium RBG_13_54_9]|nr:MAG: hypothetical protein A2Y60_04745 [Chloroflexi bacterium RBG_13_54_9]
MLRIATKTRLNPEEAIKLAVDFFGPGPGGYGLQIKEQDAACVYFEGAGGGVEVSACTDEEGTSLEVVSREWDGQVREFMTKIPH